MRLGRIKGDLGTGPIRCTAITVNRPVINELRPPEGGRYNVRMTASVPTAPTRLGQALDDYRARISTDDHARLRKFVTWLGVSVTVEAVQAYKIEEFLAQQVKTSVSPRAYLAPLKTFFAYVLEQRLIPSDPMKNVRLPRTGVAAVKKSAAAAVAAAAATGSPTHVATTSGTSRIEDVEYVSRARHEEMKKELDRLQVDERQRISALLEEAIKDGDLSENAGYEDAKMRQGLLEARIRELESKLRHVALIEDQDNDGATIGVGSRVKLREIATDDEVEYQVVGPEETDPRLGKISHRSPVGKALIGKTAGEETDVVTPGGTTRYLIVSVERGA